jgi:DNA-binding beta-propeller fold protein YncE
MFANVTQTGLDYPVSIVVDGSGRLWVADASASRILRFDGASTVTSGSSSANGVLGEPDFITGGGGTTSITVNYPAGIAIDASGTLYVADQNNNRFFALTALQAKRMAVPQMACWVKLISDLLERA